VRCPPIAPAVVPVNAESDSSPNDAVLPIKSTSSQTLKEKQSKCPPTYRSHDGGAARWLRRILASSNTPPGTVHRILGQANFATTMKLYGGLTAEALDKAAGALGDAFEPKPEVKRS
jgi:hypothetical protein